MLLLLKDGCHGLNGPYHPTQFWRRRTKLLFLWWVDMIFLSQIFPEKSAHTDGLYLFSDFRVHFREGGIGDLEQKCLVKSSALFPSTESLIVRYWLKHFLLTNSITFLICWWLRNAIGRQKMFQPTAYGQVLYRRRESGGLNWSRQDISALDLQCLPPGSEHGSPKRGITRLYGRIFPERFVA